MLRATQMKKIYFEIHEMYLNFSVGCFILSLLKNMVADVTSFSVITITHAEWLLIDEQNLKNKILLKITTIFN